MDTVPGGHSESFGPVTLSEGESLGFCLRMNPAKGPFDGGKGVAASRHHSRGTKVRSMEE